MASLKQNKKRRITRRKESKCNEIWRNHSGQFLKRLRKPQRREQCGLPPRNPAAGTRARLPSPAVPRLLSPSWISSSPSMPGRLTQAPQLGAGGDIVLQEAQTAPGHLRGVASPAAQPPAPVRGTAPYPNPHDGRGRGAPWGRVPLTSTPKPGGAHMSQRELFF